MVLKDTALTTRYPLFRCQRSLAITPSPPSPHPTPMQNPTPPRPEQTLTPPIPISSASRPRPPHPKGPPGYPFAPTSPKYSHPYRGNIGAKLPYPSVTDPTHVHDTTPTDKEPCPLDLTLDTQPKPPSPVTHQRRKEARITNPSVDVKTTTLTGVPSLHSPTVYSSQKEQEKGPLCCGKFPPSGQRSGVRGQRSGARGQPPAVRGQRSAVRGQWTDPNPKPPVAPQGPVCGVFHGEQQTTRYFAP